MTRVVQISDTHLSRATRHFAGNWEPLRRWIAAQQPDLVVHTGDVTIDGADRDDDLEFCLGLMRNLGLPFRAVPGNHDVGDANHPHQPVDDRRLARWERIFGPDRWIEDFADWRFIGIDAMLIGSGHGREAEQFTWAETVMTQAAGRRIACFLHRPLFLVDPAEDDTGYWSVKPQPRRDWLDLLGWFDVALIASGHLHKARQFTSRSTRYVWGPSSAFLCGPSVQPDMPGEKCLGAVLYEFDGRDFDAQIVRVPGLTQHWIDNILEEIYPAHSDTRPR